MKKMFLILALSLASVSAFAETNVYTCQVVLVDGYQRVLDRFYSQRDFRTGRCIDAMRDCHSEMRRYGRWGRGGRPAPGNRGLLSCREVRRRW